MRLFRQSCRRHWRARFCQRMRGSSTVYKGAPEPPKKPIMNDIRRSIEYRQWKDRVKDRDGHACRKCRYDKNLHVHHIKPLDKYPDFATVLDNGLTLCGNCHSELRGREETENLRLFLRNDPEIDRQLRLIEGRFSDYLERQLRSSTAGTRDNAVSELCSHLDVYPDSLREFVPHLEYIADSENWSDNSHHKQQAIRWLRIQVERDTNRHLT